MRHKPDVLGPRVELFSEVPKERRCHMRRLFGLLHARCMERIFLKGRKEKQQLDTNVCVQTDE